MPTTLLRQEKIAYFLNNEKASAKILLHPKPNYLFLFLFYHFSSLNLDIPPPKSSKQYLNFGVGSLLKATSPCVRIYFKKMVLRWLAQNKLMGSCCELAFIWPCCAIEHNVFNFPRVRVSHISLICPC